MMITIPIQCSMSSAEKAHFDTAFRVELYRLKSFSGAVHHKRNIMFFGHWVLYRMLSTATGAVQPHIGLAGGGTSRFFQHLQGRFVGVQHRLLTKLLAQRIVDWPQPHPQCYQSGVYGCGILPWSPFHSCWHPSPRLR